MNRTTTRLLRRATLLAMAVIVVAALGGTALAGHLTSGVKSYTGCLVPKDGVIIKVKEGDAPAGPCTAGMTQVHLSGGDITKISVGTGLKLPNGGDNGEVTIELDSKFALRQDCDAHEFLKWNGSAWVCSEHRNGTGLARTEIVSSTSGSTEYELSETYRVKNTPDCSAGQFATGFDSSGTIQCGAPPAATLPAFSGPQANFETGVGISDDGAFHVLASVNAPAGNYFVTAKGQIRSEGNVDDFSSTECRIQSGAIVFDSMRWGSVTIDDNPLTTLALAGLGNHAGGAIELACAADSGADGVGLRQGRLVVVKVG